MKCDHPYSKSPLLPLKLPVQLQLSQSKCWVVEKKWGRKVSYRTSEYASPQNVHAAMWHIDIFDWPQPGHRRIIFVEDRSHVTYHLRLEHLVICSQTTKGQRHFCGRRNSKIQTWFFFTGARNYYKSNLEYFKQWSKSIGGDGQSWIRQQTTFGGGCAKCGWNDDPPSFELSWLQFHSSFYDLW